MATRTLQARHPGREQGEAWWWFGGLATIKATAEETGGAYALLENTIPEHGAGMQGPLHVHHREDEAFYILEGEATFTIGDETFRAGPGSYVFGPKDVPHGFRVDRAPLRMLMLFAPGGFEGFVRATSEPAPGGALPDPGQGMPEMATLPRYVEEYGAEMLG